jgi:sarcosine oxidase, subunit gamma
MNTPLRLSPLHGEFDALEPRWSVFNDMPVPISIGTRESEAALLDKVALSDFSCLKRCGLKGPGAAQWLAAHDIEPPPGVNEWSAIGKCSLIARLASSEFLIEDGLGDESFADRAKAELGRGAPGVTPVLRRDAEIVLAGHAINELLLQTCSFNFASLDVSQRALVMTSMIGVSVLVIPGTWNARPFYQLWCDSTFAVYLWRHLLEIAQALGGGAVSLGALFQNFEMGT